MLELSRFVSVHAGTKGGRRKRQDLNSAPHSSGADAESALGTQRCSGLAQSLATLGDPQTGLRGHHNSSHTSFLLRQNQTQEQAGWSEAGPALGNKAFAFINPPLMPTVKFCRQEGPTPHSNRTHWAAAAGIYPVFYADKITGRTTPAQAALQEEQTPNPPFPPSFIRATEAAQLQSLGGLSREARLSWRAQPSPFMQCCPQKTSNWVNWASQRAVRLVYWGDKEFSKEFIAGSARDGSY